MISETDVDVSVIIPCFNSAATLRAAVESVSRDLRCEIIIIDDGSTDASPAIARQLSMENPGRVLVIGQANAGLSAARNIGMRIARGRYLYFLDADDEMGNGFAELAMQFLESDPTLVAVQGQVELIESHREPLPWQLQIIEGTMMGTLLLRASIAQRIGGFPTDPAFRGPVGGEDAAFRREFGRFGSVLQVATKAVRYRMRSGNHVDLFLDRANLENGKLVFTTLMPEELDGTLSRATGRYRRDVARRMLAKTLADLSHDAFATVGFTLALRELHDAGDSNLNEASRNYLLRELAHVWPAPGDVVALDVDRESLRWLESGCKASKRGQLHAAFASSDAPAPQSIRLLLVGKGSSDHLGNWMDRVSRDGLVVLDPDLADQLQVDPHRWTVAESSGSQRILQRN